MAVHSAKVLAALLAAACLQWSLAEPDHEGNCAMQVGIRRKSGGDFGDDDTPAKVADSPKATAKEATAEEPTAEEPVPEEIVAEEPAAEEPAAEESAAEEPTADEPVLSIPMLPSVSYFHHLKLRSPSPRFPTWRKPRPPSPNLLRRQKWRSLRRRRTQQWEGQRGYQIKFRAYG